MTIGILCAIPQELEHLKGALKRQHHFELVGIEFVRGMLDGHDVVLAGAGIGKVNTAMVTTLLGHEFECRLIIFSGVAGGLDPDLQIGDVVIANRTIQHDAGVFEDGKIATYQAGHVPFFNPTDELGFEVPPVIINKIKRRLEGFELPALSSRAGGQGRNPKVAVGTILSGDQYVHCEATRERLFKELGGLAVEMEGGAFGQVCEAFEIPHLDIRALSDLAGRDSSFDFATFVDEVATSSAMIVRRILPVL